MEGQQPPQPQPQASLDAPVQLSFPAILRNPGVSSRYAHLHDSRYKPAPSTTSRVPKKTRRDENGGRRWVRRKENAQFVGNPHVVAATRKDYQIQSTPIKATFPEPLPPYLPRTAKVPSRNAPELDPNSANAGRFSMSLKGMRRDLRKFGYRAEVLVRDIEAEIILWLDAGGAVISPDLRNEDVLEFPGRALEDTQTVFEVSRTPLKLVWDTSSDGFARYVVHCCARFHNVVSFSKDVSGKRLTYLLRPNVTRPDHNAAIGIDTPPATDVDSSSHFGSDSDFLSDRDAHSDLAESDIERDLPQPHLTTIPERPTPSSPLASDDEEKWSVVGGSDIDGDESENDSGGLVESIVSLSIQEEEGGDGDTTLDATPRPALPSMYSRSRLQDRRHLRSTSSPSRSPARRAARRAARRPQSGLNTK
ncbi:hypothetical protein V5O48_011458, partial [Marasmius crinis-equi]